MLFRSLYSNMWIELVTVASSVTAAVDITAAILVVIFFFIGGVANGVIKWNLQFLSVYRFYLCGYQKYYKCRNHTVVFDLEFIWSVGSIFPNWFFVGYRRSTARTNNIEMKNRRTKLQTTNSDENMKIEWNQQTPFVKVEGTRV